MAEDLWIPGSWSELDDAIQAGTFESERLDAKLQVGNAHKVCRAVAAMANYGGVLLYGVDQDRKNDQRLKHGTPLDTAAAEERISNFIRTGFLHPPTWSPRPLPHPSKAGVGYLVGVVPQSPLAPHMVTVKDDGRFYGRRGTQTHQLSAPEVDELYARRRDLRVDVRDKLHRAREWRQPMDRKAFEKTGEVRPAPKPALAQPPRSMVVLVAPQLPASSIVGRARDGEHAATWLENTWREYSKSTPRFVWRLGSDYYLAYEQANPDDAMELEVHRDGDVIVRATEVVEERGEGIYLYEHRVVDRLAETLSFAGDLYQASAYLGPVWVAVAITGLKSARSAWIKQVSQRDRRDLARQLRAELFDDHYERVTTALSIDLTRPMGLAAAIEQLLEDLFEIVTDGHGYPEGNSPLLALESP